MNYKKCIFIPMRGGSKEIHRKNLISYMGKPLLHHVLEASVQSDIEDIFVSTEDEEIKVESRKFERVQIIDRPIELAQDNSTDFEVFEHFLLKHNEYDYIIHLRATWPKITSKIISLAVNQFETLYDLCTSQRSVELTREIPWKMWKEDPYEGLPFLSPVIKPIESKEQHKTEAFSMPRQVFPKVYKQNAAIDLIKTETILKDRSTVGIKPIAFQMDDLVVGGVDIDTYGDLK